MNSAYTYLVWAILAFILLGGFIGTGAQNEPINCYEATDGSVCILSTASRVTKLRQEFKRTDDMDSCRDVPFEITAPCNACLRQLSYDKRLLCQQPVCLCHTVTVQQTTQYEVRKVATSLAANHISCRQSTPPNPNYFSRVPISVCNKAIKDGNSSDGIWYKVAKACKDL